MRFVIYEAAGSHNHRMYICISLIGIFSYYLKAVSQLEIDIYNVPECCQEVQLYLGYSLKPDLRIFQNHEPLVTKDTRFLGTPHYRKNINQAIPIVPTVLIILRYF